MVTLQEGRTGPRGLRSTEGRTRGWVSTAVCAWAEAAEIVLLEPDDSGALPAGSLQVKSIYWFSSRAHFQAYEREGAPALRAEGLELARELGGIHFQRASGWSFAER